MITHDFLKIFAKMHMLERIKMKIWIANYGKHFILTSFKGKEPRFSISYLVLRTAKLGAITKGYAEVGKASDNFICIQLLQKPCTSFCATVPINFILHEVKQERLWHVFAFNFDHSWCTGNNVNLIFPQTHRFLLQSKAK